MGASFSPRRFRAAVTGISPREVHSKFWRRNARIIRACTAKSSMPAATLLWRTPMRTCRSRPEENLFRPRCITLCALLAPMECMPDIYQAIRRRMAVFGCRSSTRSRSSTQSVLALRSRCTEGRLRGGTWGNRGRHFHGVIIGLEIRASVQDLRRLRHLGGGDKGILLLE